MKFRMSHWLNSIVNGTLIRWCRTTVTRTVSLRYIHEVAVLIYLTWIITYNVQFWVIIGVRDALSNTTTVTDLSEVLMVEIISIFFNYITHYYFIYYIFIR